MSCLLFRRLIKKMAAIYWLVANHAQTIRSKKIRYQLQSQGFNHIADLSKDGDVPYFMTDTIHPGWRGWLKIDRAVDPFLTKQVNPPHYHIDNRFYSKKIGNSIMIK